MARRNTPCCRKLPVPLAASIQSAPSIPLMRHSVDDIEGHQLLLVVYGRILVFQMLAVDPLLPLHKGSPPAAVVMSKAVKPEFGTGNGAKQLFTTPILCTTRMRVSIYLPAGGKERKVSRYNLEYRHGCSRIKHASGLKKPPSGGEYCSRIVLTLQGWDHGYHLADRE